MRYDDYDDYNSRSRRDSRSRSGSSSSSYDRGSSRSRDSYSRGSSYDRDSYSRGSSYDRGYEDRYDRSYGSGGYSDYDRRYGQSYDRYGGRTRSSFDSFDEENWRRTAPNWVDHSEPDPPPRRRSSSDRGRDSRSGDRRRSSDYDRRSSSGDRRRSSSDRRYDDRRRSGSSSRNGRNGRRPDDRRRSRGVNPMPIILLVVVVILAAVLIHTLMGNHGKGRYSISFSNQNIVVGETAEATLNGLENPGSTEVVWSSGDNNVISVSGDGVVCTLTAKSTGQCTIGATIDGETVASGSVMVVATAPGVEEIRLTQEQVSIEAGSQYTIQATVVMEKDDMSPAKIKWTSSDPDVARVSDNGIIEGRQVGQAIIKGTAGEKTAEMVVTVTENTSNTRYDESGNVGQEPEEGVTIPADADNTLDPNNSETGGAADAGGEGTEAEVVPD